MHVRFLVSALAMLLVNAPGFASDEVRVEILRFSSGGCDGATTTLYFDSGAPINLTVGACDKRIDIWVPDQPFTYDIGPVTLNGNGGPFLELFIGAGSFPYGGGGMTPAARNLAGISIVEDSLREDTRFAGRIYGNLTGSVRVGELYRFDVDGQVKAQIRGNEAGPALFDIHMGSSTAGGVILCDAGPMAGVLSQGNVLGRIEATTGGISSIEVLNTADLLADVIAGGSITAIEVAGDIGTSVDPVAIDAVDGIRKIVGSSVYADIDAGDGGADDALWYLETTGGDFAGSLECRDINSTETPSGLDIAGDLNADLRITRNVNEPLLAHSSRVAGSRLASF